jgi:preprotein translocase subunit SecA
VRHLDHLVAHPGESASAALLTGQEPTPQAHAAGEGAHVLTTNDYLAIDRCWSDYLEDMRALRSEIRVVSLDGRDPPAYSDEIPVE